ncbi:hypothetical protein ACXNAM_00030 [Kluyvera cryocrescens]
MISNNNETKESTLVKWGKRLIFAIAVMIVARAVGSYLGKQSAIDMQQRRQQADERVHPNKPKTAAEGYALGEKVMEAAMNKPATPNCISHAEGSMRYMQKTITFPDPAAVTDYLAKACTGGYDIASKMIHEWGYSRDDVNKASAELSGMTQNITTKFIGNGIDKDVAPSLASEYIGSVQSGYELAGLETLDRR